VADEPRVDHLELAAEVEDGTPAAGAAEVIAGLLGGGVAVLERHVLHDQARPLLVEAVRAGGPQRLVAGVHVQDPPRAAAADRHHPAAVQDDPPAGVADLGRGLHRDRHRAGPQENVITPPAATAATTACEVQPAGVPSPMTWSGWLVLTGRPAGGTDAWPAGLPAAGSRTGDGDGDGLGLGAGELDIPARATAELAAPATAAPTPGDPALG